MSTSARFYTVVFLAFAAIMACTLLKWATEDTDIYAGSISDQPAETIELKPQSQVTSQPTILKADSDASPHPVLSPIDAAQLPLDRMPITDQDNGTPASLPDLAPAEFLTIPSLEPAHRR